MTVSLTREQWRTAIDEVSPATFGELVRVIAESDVVEGNPEAIVEDAIAEDGPLVEDESSAGAFSEYTLREEDETAETDDERGAVGDSPASNPTPDGEKTGTNTATREDAVAALRDVLQFYHNHVDQTIDDHTEDGEHPDRPTTAREYFTDVRGWSDETVEDLLLGWAPPDHVDELVAYLFNRGHNREAILATGAVGESESGGFYTTFAGRYVLPYYDEDGDPAYAIARCTGGQGGGAKGYGGHPRDYQAGKYAKLRHTDVRVPFDEPIYGLDTLDDADHVLVAEGIADAITAREAGYAVLSPVAKEFKQEHFPPLVEALEGYGVGRMTVVADADNRRQDTDDEGEPDSIHTAVGRTLAPVAPGLAGALRTAAGVKERTDGLDVRVGVPPAPGETTSDLDEFVTEWDGDLGAVLRSARPPELFPEFEAADSGRSRAGTGRSGGNTDRGEVDIDVGDAPDDLPACYQSALEARTAPGSTGFDSNHDLNLLVANLGVYAGYETDTLVEHFANYPLNNDEGNFDAGLTRKAIEATRRKIDRGSLAPPSADRLREKGILDGDCSCHIHSHDETYRRDPTEADVVLEPKRAWDAAEAVHPDDLDDQPLETDGDTWVEPGTGREVPDVVRAVAIDEYPDVDVDTALTDRYADAYRIARDQYDAPLPEYLTQADAVERFDYVLGAVRELTYWHLDEEALTANVTGEDGDVAGEAVRTLDPTPVDGWRDSESGTSVLVFPSGTVYDADLGDDGCVIDTLRFVATDVGLIDQPTDPLEGEDFTEAYRIARDEYGAPLPRWNAGTPDVTPVLPPAEDLVDDPDDLESAHDRLDDLRGETESLYRDAISDADTVDVLNVLPALGKTTSAIKTAANQPTTYLAPRKELMEQAAAKASEHGASYQHLPVFSEANLDRAFVDIGVEAVRDRGKDLLRNRWELLDAVDATGNGEIYDEGEDGDSETADLDRATCPTAEGEHGDAWALAVHVARALDYTPRDIHERAEALFGTSLPCQDDEGETCDYTDGWDAVSNPDQPVDLLIGHYAHAHVESARTYYERAGNGRVRKSARAVVLDEFVGRAFTETFDEDALEHAVWLASALTDTVDDRQDLLERDVWDDELVRVWLKGEAAEEGGPTHGLVTSLRARSEALSAATTAAEILEGREDVLKNHGLYEPLSRVRDEALELSSEERAAIAGTIRTTADTVEPASGGFRVIQWANDEVAGPLAESADYDLEVDPSQLPDGELRAFVKQALDSDQPGVLRAAATALSGGNDGARELSVFADDGYAHRKAHYLLEAAIRPPQERDTAKIHTEQFTFGTEGGTTLKHVKVNDKVTVVLDRNGRGAEVLQPPARTAGGGDPVPVVGLDATARRRLWEVALGDSVRVRGVHDSMRERARTLRDAHDLQIVQTSDLAKSYSGDPDGKNLDADVALLEAIADQYSGVHGPRDRDEAADVLGNPAAITTKDVREVLENDGRLDDVVETWDNYGNLKGSNDLADHRLAALLGAQHYGDDEIERFSALAGEEVTRTGRGMALGYGSDVANTYLQHMREDQVMQAALRFARGGSGAVVFVHTAAIREDLPVVGRGEVVKSWSETATTIAEAWKRTPAEEFTVADVADTVDVTKRQVRRVLDEFVTTGFLERHDPGEGRANGFTPRDQPGAGEVSLDADVATPGGDPGQDPLEVYYTANVRVAPADSLLDAVAHAETTPLPAPNTIGDGEAVAGPPG